MALRQRKHFRDVEHVEAIAAGVCEDLSAPSGEWICRQGTVWEAGHPLVQKCPSWFVEFGRGSTTAPFFPARDDGE